MKDSEKMSRREFLQKALAWMAVWAAGILWVKKTPPQETPVKPQLSARPARHYKIWAG